MNPATVIAILTALVQEGPEIVKAISDFVAGLEGQPAPQAPLAPQVEADTSALDNALNSPLPSK